MKTSTPTICNLAQNTPEFRLINNIIEALPNYHWLADITGRVWAKSPSAKRITKKTNILPTLSGYQFQIHLTELLHDIPTYDVKNEKHRISEKDASVKLLGLELELEGETKIADLQISALPAVIENKHLFLISITPYKSDNAQTETKNKQRIDGMTDLAAKIAHEINNPLDGSIRFINLALRRLTEDINEASPEKLTEYLSSARNALGKINDILSDLSNFAKCGQAKIENISINDLINQAIQTFSAQLKAENINVITMLSDDIPDTGGTKLYQVFCNLLKNAIDAINEKRKKDQASNAVITITSQFKNNTITITFEDTGIGLPKQKQYLFDPFYTTKTHENGMGLGLAICKEIIEQYGGTITAENRKAGGAKFIITLKPNMQITAKEKN